MIDIGVNLLHPQFDRDRERVVERARAAGVRGMIVTGTNLSDTATAIEWCQQAGDGIRCTAGVHPHEAEGLPAGWVVELERLATAPPVCAIGETGLDFYRGFAPRSIQRDVFEAQIALANELNLPLFVHDRDTEGAVFDCLRNATVSLVVHCFTGDAQDLTRYLDAGYYIGVTGWVCDTRRGDRLRRLVPDIPLDRLLVETDAPFLRPHDAPGNSRRNEPALLPLIVSRVADLKGLDPDSVANATRDNARRLFRLADA